MIRRRGVDGSSPDVGRVPGAGRPGARRPHAPDEARVRDVRRDVLRARLTEELGDADLAEAVSADLGDDQLAAIDDACGGDIAASPFLDYTPERVADDDVDSLWVLAYGYRILPTAGIDGVDSLRPGALRSATSPRGRSTKRSPRPRRPSSLGDPCPCSPNGRSPTCSPTSGSTG